MSGVKSESAAIWLSAVTAAVNFIFTFVGIYLVERIGRRPLTLGSLIGMTPKTKPDNYLYPTKRQVYHVYDSDVSNDTTVITI